MWAAIIIAAAQMYSAYQSSRSAKKAAEAQRSAAEQGIGAELEMYYQSREDMAPWREAGGRSLNALSGLMEKGPGAFKESPSYRFTLGEGMKGIERAKSATGRLGSGSFVKDATRYAEGMASTEYDNFLRRYYESLNPHLAVAGMGQVGATQTAQAGQSTANALANLYLQKGQAGAAGIMGSTYPYAQLANWGAGNAMNWYMMNQGKGAAPQSGGNALTAEEIDQATYL